MFFAVTSVTPHHLINWILHNYVLFCYFTLVPRKEFADFISKTTRCLMKNITSFYEKQHVVLWKTTRRFVRNNTSFCEKQHVVLWETTRHFMRNYSSDFHKIFGKNTQKRDKSSHFFQISIRDQRTKFLTPLHFIDILHLTEKLWHLWQQKNNIAVGRRALRVHAREFFPLRSPRSSPSLGWQLGYPIIFGQFWQMRVAKQSFSKKHCHFSAIFSLFPPFWTHIL